MTDRIIVSDLVLRGHHGVFEEETRLGQKFHVDMECHLDLSPSGGSDDYGKTVCYGRLCELAAEVSNAGPYQLIETLGEKIAAQALSEFPALREIHVQIRKPNAPIDAVFDHVAIEVRRKRQRSFALSLGTNLGDKETNLTLALTLLSTGDDMSIDNVSRFYRTAPWGKQDQDWFMNVCATGTTSLSPEQLLHRCKELELRIGRVPSERWGPRLIDIDVLTMGDLNIARRDITLPHPHMMERAFVLKPLAEIAPAMAINGQPIVKALADLEKNQSAEDAVTPID